MLRLKHSKSFNNRTLRSRSCRNKDVILSSSDRNLRKVKTRGEKFSETVKSSTPVKSSPNASSRESFGSDRENLPIPLSPIAACDNIKKKANSKEVKKCKSTTRKRLGDLFDDNNAGEPKWKQTRRRTYCKSGETSSEPSSPELKDPFSLFSRPDERQPKLKPIEVTPPAKISKAQQKSKKLDKKFEKEFQDWCKQFSEDLEVAAQTELIIE